MPRTRVLELLPLHPILYASATKRARVSHISKQLASWTVPGTAVIVFKLLETPRSESAAKRKEGMIIALIEGKIIVALIEPDNIGGPAKEINLLKDWHALAFKKIARQFLQTTIKAINPHQEKIRESVLLIFNCCSTCILYFSQRFSLCPDKRRIFSRPPFFFPTRHFKV